MNLTIEGVGKRYRGNVWGLREFSLALQPGVLGLLGPNGAGKSTLMRILATITKPTEGWVAWEGADIVREPDRLRSVLGYLPQDFGVYPNLNAVEFLEYLAAVKGLDPGAARRRIDELLVLVNLTEARKRPLGGYSGGMKQRVAVARTLLRRPPIIIVDEPTVGLDPRERIRFRNLLAKLAEGRVVLFSTHVVEDVAVSCQRVIVMRKGRIVYDGQPAELAALAEGRTWEIRLSAGELPSLPPDSKLVDQVPEADGVMRVRVLATSQPHPAARAIAPVIEDGYLKLVNWGAD